MTEKEKEIVDTAAAYPVYMKVEDAQEAAARWFNKAMAQGVSRIVTNANNTTIEEMEHVQ